MQEAPNQGAEGDAEAHDPWAEAGGQSPLGAPSEGHAASEHPEILVGAAFVGGFALAQIVKRLGQ
jgi:hypothetical protein